MIYVVFFSTAGVPATGLTPTIGVYKKVSDGTDVTPAPTVSEIGGGFYKFTATPAEALVVRMNGGGSLAEADKYKVMQITPHDADLDTQVSTRGSQADLTAIKAKTDNLPAAPAVEGNVQGHVADALAAYDPPTKAELDAAVAPLALEAGLEAHVLAVLNSYDPPTRDEATADKTAILAAVAALNDLTLGEILGGDLSDSLSFPANSLADLVRKLFWVVCNRLVITDASGAFTAYKTDGVTPAAAGTVTDNGTTTARSKPTWP
jgi:hypothetical protein